jgi:hypothetical protein
VVPYVIDPSIKDPEPILKAMKEWERAGIRFPRRTAQPDYLVFTLSKRVKSDPIEEEPQDIAGASSAVGRRGGRQCIEAGGPNVPWWRYVHEIGHTLGLYHEQLRLDRDRHLTIHWDNIKPAARHNFEIKKGKSVDVGTFNIESIMLYAWNLDAIDTAKPTITWNRDPSYRGFGASVRQRISDGDIKTIHYLYFEGGIAELRGPHRNSR